MEGRILSSIIKFYQTMKPSITSYLLAVMLTLACLIPIARSADAPFLETKTGLAAFYSSDLDGTKTTSGVRLDNDQMVAAHSSYPFGTRVKVTNLKNEETVEVKIIDNLPSKSNRKKGVIIDVSGAAAAKLKMLKAGHVRVRVDVLEWGQEKRKHG